jgi:predicted nucleic acid-binding protein
VNLYLDTSALVKLYVTEESAELVRETVAQARLVATAAIAYVEARAAFARRRHEGALPPPEHRRIVHDLDADWGHYLRIEITESLIREASRLAERHRLRAYDAIHLASANTLKSRLADTVVFACWDTLLEAAAHREGLDLIPRRKVRR